MWASVDEVSRSARIRQELANVDHELVSMTHKAQTTQRHLGVRNKPGRLQRTAWSMFKSVDFERDIPAKPDKVVVRSRRRAKSCPRF